MKKLVVVISIVTLAITSAFQACSSGRGHSFNASMNSTPTQNSGNGDGYGGKLMVYDYVNTEDPCAEKGANGKPLPNDQIFLYKDRPHQLVRQECIDISPVDLAANEITLNDPTNPTQVIYSGLTYTKETFVSDFDVVAATCPAGLNPIQNATRTNLIPHSQNLTEPSLWNGNITVTLNGSLGSLPAFKIERTDPLNLANWHRVTYSPLVTAGRTYVYSFFAKTQTTDKAFFISYSPNVHDLEVEFDLITGTANVITAVGTTNISSVATPFANGLFISLYFQTTVTTSANMGVSSLGANLGDNITVTAIQFEDVASFCGP